MKRRAVIAQTLVHKPSVLILDEPTAGVDVDLRPSMLRFVKRSHNEEHMIVLTIHYIEEAGELRDSIAIINQGCLIALESKQELLARGLGAELLVRAAYPLLGIPDDLQDKTLRLEESDVELSLHMEEDSIMDILDRLRASAMSIEHVSLERDSLQTIFVQTTNTKGRSSGD